MFALFKANTYIYVCVYNVNFVTYLKCNLADQLFGFKIILLKIELRVNKIILQLSYDAILAKYVKVPKEKKGLT